MELTFMVWYVCMRGARCETGGVEIRLFHRDLTRLISRLCIWLYVSSWSLKYTTAFLQCWETDTWRLFFFWKGGKSGRNHWQEEFRLRWLNTVHVVATQAVAAQALAAQSTAVAHGTWIHLRSLKVLPGWGVSTRRMWKTGGNRKLSWVMRKNSSALILLYLKSIWPSYKIGGCSYSAKRVNQGEPHRQMCAYMYTWLSTAAMHNNGVPSMLRNRYFTAVLSLQIKEEITDRKNWL